MKKIKKALVFLMAFMLIAAAFPTMALAADEEVDPNAGSAGDGNVVEDTLDELDDEEPIIEEPEEEVQEEESVAEPVVLAEEGIPVGQADPAPSATFNMVDGDTFMGKPASAFAPSVAYTVSGTNVTPNNVVLTKLTDFTAFSSDPAMQNGYYLPICIQPTPANAAMSLIINSGTPQAISPGNNCLVRITPGGAATIVIKVGTTEYTIVRSALKFSLPIKSAVIEENAAKKLVLTMDVNASGIKDFANTDFIVKKDGNTASLTTPAPAISEDGSTITLTLAADALPGETYTVQMADPFVSEAVDVDAIPAADKTALEAQITRANEASENVVIAANGTNVSKDRQWIAESDPAYTAFNSALSAAETVMENKNATQVAVDSATATLKAAITDYISALDYGEKEPIDYTALQEEIDKAKALSEDITVNDGAPNTVAEGKQFVTSAVATALNTAITHAENMIKNDSATNAKDVSNEILDLQNAENTFKKNIQTGTKKVDYSALEELIEVAQSTKDALIVSKDGTDVSESNQWVTESAMNKLEAAILAAQDMVENDSAEKQSQIDTQVDTLQAAIDAINAAAKPGLAEDPDLAVAEDAPNSAIAVGSNDKLEAPAITGLDAPAQGEAVPATNTASEFLKNFTAPEGYTIVLEDEDGNTVVGNPTVGTGMIVAIVDSHGQTVSENIVIVKGDTTGDGTVSLLGAGRLARYIMGNSDALTAPQQAAGDMNGDGKLELLDFGMMARIILGAQN